VDEQAESLVRERPPLARVAAAAIRLAGEIGRPAAWAAQVAARPRLVLAGAFASDLLGRFETGGAPGMRAASLSGRFAHDALDLDALELTISPYAPPLRQLSTARQGAPMWSAQAPTPPVARARAAATRPEPDGRPTSRGGIPDDLRALLDLHRSKGHVS
jgi:hypothetical protein